MKIYCYCIQQTARCPLRDSLFHSFPPTQMHAYIASDARTTSRYFVLILCALIALLQNSHGAPNQHKRTSDDGDDVLLTNSSTNSSHYIGTRQYFAFGYSSYASHSNGFSKSVRKRHTRSTTSGMLTWIYDSCPYVFRIMQLVRKLP